MRLLNPGDVLILMHCYAIAEPLPDGFTQTVERLTNFGLVEAYKNGRCTHRTTDRGSAMAELLCATPLPVQKWVDSREKP